jgi:hypothetical protein
LGRGCLLGAADREGRERGQEAVVPLFVGDDWAEDHHDVEVCDETGRRLGKARLAEGMAGMSRLHELLARAPR